MGQAVSDMTYAFLLLALSWRVVFETKLPYFHYIVLLNVHLLHDLCPFSGLPPFSQMCLLMAVPTLL